MRLRLLTTLGTMALVLAAPGAALATHGDHRHHRAEHHHGRGKAHHARFHFVHIAPTTATPGTGAPAGGTGGGAQTPATPPSTPENAATVTSYSGGMLTLTLNDGSSVSGKVTNNTVIRCAAPSPLPVTEGEGQPGERSPDEDNDRGDDHGGGDMSGQDQHGPGDSKGPGRHDGNDEDKDQESVEAPCDSSALVAGAIVRAAELRIGPAGSEFQAIELVR